VVDKLRETCPSLLSLVTVLDRQVVGHILFSPTVIDCNGIHVQGVGLAPVAVLPEFQYQGIGSELTRRGIEILRKMDVPFVIVLGHADYYPRFGFGKASRYEIVSQWDGIPDEVFMILILNPEVMEGVSGIARYRDEFNEAM